MASYSVLGQQNPSSTSSLTTLVTATSSTGTVVSSVVICNQAATAATYRIAVRPSGATIANQHYLAYDVQVNGNDTTTITLGISLTATDVITVYASTAYFSFGVFGSEIS